MLVKSITWCYFPPHRHYSPIHQKLCVGDNDAHNNAELQQLTFGRALSADSDKLLLCEDSSHAPRAVFQNPAEHFLGGGLYKGTPLRWLEPLHR